MERSGEPLGRLADQEGMGDARKIGLEPIEARLLGAAAEDPVDRLVAGERLLRGVGVGRLAVIDIGDAADGGDQLLPVRQPGKDLMPATIFSTAISSARQAA